MTIKKPWVRFPLCFLDTVSCPAAVLMSILLGVAGSDLRVRCKQQELADRLHFSLRTVGQLLNELQGAGYILSREQQGYQTVFTLAPNLIPAAENTCIPQKRRGNYPPTPENASFDIAELEQRINNF